MNNFQVLPRAKNNGEDIKAAIGEFLFLSRKPISSSRFNSRLFGRIYSFLRKAVSLVASGLYFDKNYCLALAGNYVYLGMLITEALGQNLVTLCLEIIDRRAFADFSQLMSRRNLAGHPYFTSLILLWEEPSSGFPAGYLQG